MKKYIIFIILSLGLLVSSCGDMNEVSKGFLTEETRYAGSPDTIKVLAGYNRAMLYFRITDATVTSMTVYWNNRTKTMEIPIHMDVCPKIYSVEIPNLPEGSYSFEIVTKDVLGNGSIISRVVGKVYGDEYYKSLLNTPLRAYRTDPAVPSKIEAVWGSPDLSALGMEFIYTNTSGQEVKKYIEVPKEENVVFQPKMQLPDYSTGTPLKYRTFYLPEVAAIDTFITAYKNVPVKGFAVDYPRSGWTVLYGKYDTGNPRPPQNLFDGNTNTVWHMDKTPGKYPHYIEIDMGAEFKITGFYVQHRLPITTPAKAIAFHIGNPQKDETGNIILDDTGKPVIKWDAVGEYTMSNTISDIQRFDLQTDVNCRYFRLTVKSDYNNGGSTALSEMGTYIRQEL